MKLLAIETATEACSAALLIDDETHLRYEVKPRGHSELLLSMMDDLLAEAELTPSQLDAMAFGRGPGSFTGVRIATGVVQGAAFAAGLPVVPVSTLAALAQRAFREKGERHLLPSYDARMGELYWAAYKVGEDELVRLVIEEEVATAERVSLPIDGEWYGIGSGWTAGAEILEKRLQGVLLGYQAQMLCSAREIALLAAADFDRGLAVSAENALPVYLRNQVAHKAT
ncbi:MAG: tRNA (adenosine(37)-N6)-threonylcarbamoyltransferase complex dimerization subunit type 1 TsaB [Candidatus Thiodiazotropha sp. (ex Semelilucina semeliformis)]|nr:tRNA (adenosine(37)-N6)-threonylcarbamoyltransferase complex dimerization subunit type 1 TsaB [Candidatus Thiodiazotropha sp. (ex Myrtea spinifera)]MCU7806732.1 tRNA (adenosine(37)-N6)-threonylcarbamoyltransferase complex dimerization subunit type 1 TsaB [Candidatus Thiodiazotropha sp. (ex Semelilucina semeliformis)]MCU7827897.1 tRNA (adenosine(37)-N6)-threonylcarbamoyltransferase complex dimerization subunit type 1 TsaB [Candidatus Thiodiazotropha sp. (ex Myrtea sp. 'scaly one' KF741663)]